MNYFITTTLQLILSLLSLNSPLSLSLFLSLSVCVCVCVCVCFDTTGSHKDEPHHEKTNNVISKHVSHEHRIWLEAGNFCFIKKRNCTIRIMKRKALISFAVTAKLIFTFVLAYTMRWSSHEVAQIRFLFD